MRSSDVGRTSHLNKKEGKTVDQEVVLKISNIIDKTLMIDILLKNNYEVSEKYILSNNQDKSYWEIIIKNNDNGNLFNYEYVSPLSPLSKQQMEVQHQ